MFKADMLRVGRAAYINDTVSKINDLAYLDFEVDAVEAFRAASQLHAANLAAQGAQRFEKRNTSVTFFGSNVKIEVDSPNDEWSYRLSAFVKMVGFNSGMLKPTPWEALLHAPGTLQGIPEACKIPASLVETAAIVRDEILDIIGPAPKTIAVMLKDIRAGTRS